MSEDEEFDLEEFIYNSSEDILCLLEDMEVEEIDSELLAQQIEKSLTNRLKLGGWKKSPWISVETKMPEIDNLVLVYIPWIGVCVRSMSSTNDWFDECNDYDDSGYPVSHWQSLPPSPPKEESDT